MENNRSYYALPQYLDLFGPDSDKPMTMEELTYMARVWGIGLSDILDQVELR